MKIKQYPFVVFFLLLAASLYAQEDLFYYAAQQKARIDCSIYKTRIVQADEALNLQTPNSFNAQMSAYLTERLTEDKGIEQKLQLIKHFDEKDELTKIEARSLFVGIGKNKQAIRIRVLSTYYYLREDNYILVHQATSMDGAEMQDAFDTGWILFDSRSGEVEIMVVNDEVQDEVAMERSENEKVARVSYIGALLFKELK